MREGSFNAPFDSGVIEWQRPVAGLESRDR